MKIALIYGEPVQFDVTSLERGLGGTESSIIRYSWALQEHGAQVTVYCKADHPEQDGEITWVTLDPTECLEADVAIYVKRVASEITVASQHKYVLLMERTIPDDLLSWVENGYVDRIITTSQWQEEQMIAKFPSLANRVFSSGLGVDTRDFSRTVPKERGLCIFTTVPYRGLDVLLEVWPQIKENVPFATLRIVSSYLIWGDSMQENQAKCQTFFARINQLQDSGVINELQSRNITTRGLGYQEMVELQERAEVLLYPSTYDDSFCLAALEASAAGTVVITSNRGALQERVIQGETGYLIDGDPYSEEYKAELIEKVTQVLLNPELREAMAEKSLELAEKHDMSRLAKDWLEEFQSKLSTPANQ